MKMKFRCWMAAGTLAAALLAQAASGAVFLEFEPIEGESTDARHRDEIDVLGWSWGMTQPGRALTEPGIVDIKGITIQKRTDRATPKLMQFCANGQHLERGVLTLRAAGSEDAVEFYRVVLEDVVVSRVSTDGNGAEVAEEVELSFARAGVEYVRIKPTGEPEPIRFSWDLAMNREGGVTFPGDPPPPDADEDGLPDEWERAYGLDTGSNSAGEDADRDGATNYDEFIAGTNPTNADEVLKARMEPGTGAGTLEWSSAAGKQYRVLLSPTVEGPFTEYDVVDSAGAGSTSVAVPVGAAMNFFRIEVVQP